MAGKKKKTGKLEGGSATKKAGTTFGVSRINRFLRQGRYAEKYGIGAGIFLSAVMGYLTREVLTLAIEALPAD